MIAEESGAFSIDDVARGITEKMYRRNPHVFGPASDDPPADAAAVNEVWQAIKERDKPRASPTDGLPDTLPALLYAAKVVERSETTATAIRLPEPAENNPSDRRRIGERLLALVAEAVADGVDPEQALRDAVRRRG